MCLPPILMKKMGDRKIYIHVQWYVYPERKPCNIYYGDFPDQTESTSQEKEKT